MRRLNGVLSDKEFAHIQKLQIEYFSKHLQQSVFLYKIDKQKTNPSVSFDEAAAEEIYFEDPVELLCIAELKPKENISYSENQTARYEEFGNLIVHILELTLTSQNINIEYGDYIAYYIKNKFIYFTVSDNDFKNISNEKTFGAFEPAFKSILCVPVEQNEIIPA